VTILHIDSSINGENSASRELTRSIVDQLASSNWGASVAHRDLAAAPLPHLTLEAFADSTVLDEFLAADTVVIGAPMYNFTIPSQLKAWLDRLGVPGVTFSYSEAGPQGLAGPKRVIVASSQGGAYDLDAPFEHHESYLRDFLAFIGIADPVFVRAGRIGFGPEVRDAAVAAARETIARLEAPAELLAA